MEAVSTINQISSAGLVAKPKPKLATRLFKPMASTVTIRLQAQRISHEGPDLSGLTGERTSCRIYGSSKTRSLQ